MPRDGRSTLLHVADPAAAPSRRPLVPVTAAVLVALLVALLAYGMLRGGDSATLDEAVKRGEFPQAPGQELALARLSGPGTVSLASLRGQVVVLNFWAHWCDPCRDEAPVLEAVHRRMQRERTGTVLGATYDDPPVDARAFVRRYRLTYPSVTDVGTKLAREFGTNKLPETFVLDRDGRIVAIARGQVDRAFLDQAVRQAARS